MLSNEQIKELIKSPRNAANLKKAIDHEDRLKFHGQVVTDSYVIDGPAKESIAELPYFQKYLLWVKSIITAKDKYEQFKKLLVFPIKTNEIVDDISDEYTKIFDAEDAYFNVELSEDELKEDFNNYLQQIKDTDFWHDDAFNAMMKAINSIIIVDLPAQQLTDRPEPYYYLLDIRSVIDISINKSGGVDYIIFKDSETRIAIFDDVFYKVFEVQKDKSIVLISESAHGLGFCPAKTFWSDTIEPKNQINKLSPISAMLSRLDWQLFFETAKQSLDVYAAYPIYWAYESKCDFVDHAGNRCINGLITFFDDQNKVEVVKPCPVCESKKIVGPGSLIEAPLPRPNGTGILSLQVPPAGIITVDKNSLDYNVNEAERLKTEIIAGSTGKMKLLNKQAINQDQVQSQFENQTNILNWIARNFEKAHQWAWDTVGKLRYGDLYIGSTVSYGTTFYLQSLNDAVKDFNDSKTAGIPGYILLSKVAKIEHLQGKFNPEMKNKLNILKYLEPYPTLTLKECKDLGLDQMDKIGFVLKSNFANFVSKFELEFGSLIEFGSALDFKTKIEKIAGKLNEYATLIVKPADPADGGGELGKLPLAIQQLSLAMFRAEQTGNNGQAELLKQKITELTNSINS
jgi:hypothetical protein